MTFVKSGLECQKGASVVISISSEDVLFLLKRETQAKELKDKPKPTKADVSGDLIKVTSVKKVQTLSLCLFVMVYGFNRLSSNQT